MACYLLGLKEVQDVEITYFKGALFENLVINQFVKQYLNQGEEPVISFWRDSQGNEVDLLVDNGDRRVAYEIKSSHTFNNTFFKGLDKWGKLSGTTVDRLKVIYAGSEQFTTSNGELLSFPKLY